VKLLFAPGELDKAASAAIEQKSPEPLYEALGIREDDVVPFGWGHEEIVVLRKSISHLIDVAVRNGWSASWLIPKMGAYGRGIIRIADPLAPFVRTPGLREKVMRCVEKVMEQGFEIDRGSYCDDSTCCVLGAVSLCEDPDAADDLIARKPAFLLTARHLGCDPWEIDSLEAGFEGYSVSVILRDMAPPVGKDAVTRVMARVTFDEEAFSIGEEVYRRYAVKENY